MNVSSIWVHFNDWGHQDVIQYLVMLLCIMWHHWVSWDVTWHHVDILLKLGPMCSGTRSHKNAFRYKTVIYDLGYRCIIIISIWQRVPKSNKMLVSAEGKSYAYIWWSFDFKPFLFKDHYCKEYEVWVWRHSDNYFYIILIFEWSQVWFLASPFLDKL